MGTLRVALALCVVIGHTGPLGGKLTFIGGNAAVQMFYIISGFYMALILNEKYGEPGAGTWRFYANRLLRIFPPYLVVLALSVALTLGAHVLVGAPLEAAAYWSRFSPTLQPGTYAALFLSNLLLFGQDVLMFFGLNPNTGTLYATTAYFREPVAAWKFLFVPQAWSIGLELTFYLIAPFLVRRSTRVILCVMALSVTLRVLLAATAGLAGDPWSYRFFPNEIATFLIGVTGYRAYRYLRDASRLPKVMWGWCCLGLLLVMIAVLPQFAAPRIVAATVYLFAGLSIPLIFHSSRTLSRDRYIGELSYPIYLVHMLIIQVLALFHLSGTALTIAFTIVAAVMLQYFVDSPIDRYRHRQWKAA
jgi:peptidoglycan/LPS O-acetylase OafA/YrhL